MAHDTLLTMVQASCDEMGIVSPAILIGNTDRQAKQLLALANRNIREIAAQAGPNGGWPILRKEWVFNLQVGVDNYDFPTDLAYFMPSTAWDRSFRWQLLGPLDAQEWQVLKSGISPVGPRVRFRMMAGKIYFDPVPSSTDTIVFEYYSNAWCLSAASVPQTKFQADTDTIQLDDDVFNLGLQWRFKQKKGLDYSEEKRMYDDALDRALARTAPARDLPLNARSTGNRLLNYNNVPDTGFGS